MLFLVKLALLAVSIIAALLAVSIIADIPHLLFFFKKRRHCIWLFLIINLVGKRRSRSNIWWSSPTSRCTRASRG